MKYISFLKKIYRFFFFRVYHGITTPIRKVFRTIEQENRYIAQMNVVTETHKKTFGEYKNKYSGKDIVIIAPGPSLNKYKKLENVINIGVNKACLCDKIKLDYFFAIDYLATKEYLDKLLEYPNKNLQIFLGVEAKRAHNFQEFRIKVIMPESKILKLKARKFFVYSKYPPYGTDFNVDIDKTWVVEGNSVIFSAIQFALFTNPKKIYLVGCDCTSGYFDLKNKKIKSNKTLIRIWKELREFARTYYPDTEIISVNPVGLKGVFKDLYQDGE